MQSDHKEGRAEQQATVESTAFSLQKCALGPSQLSGCISSSDSGDESTETQTSELCELPQGDLSSAGAANPSSLEYSEETDADPLIQAAIRRMNKLDTILAKKHLKERAIKKQGKEMRAKLWEELQQPLRSTGGQEEMENTNLFLALSSSWQDTAEASHAEEDEVCRSVFHTPDSPGDDDSHKHNQAADHPGELEKDEFPQEAEKAQSKSKTNQDFIMKNIELAKDSGNQVVLLEDERKRLTELLRDTEEGTELQGLEENGCGWLASGEGYTPDPMEFHQLKEIERKLQALLSAGAPPGLLPSHHYQGTLAHAKRGPEAAPGEKVLRDNKEQRDQEKRLKEIDLQLQSLGGKLPAPQGFSPPQGLTRPGGT
ncbi:fibrous sheath-interacting protein 1 [Melanerpes formicivorus]|uniref:fibrous sheath-interacting protein 1 n=1 Tax=Melanerpes formicivorus TaxID=211600 RepID=UPI00358F3E96